MTPKDTPAPAAEIAHAMSECMNLLFLFAAPRVLASVRGSGMGGLDREAAFGSLRRFLRTASGVRARTARGDADIDRLGDAAILVEEIAGTLGNVRFEDPLPAVVVDRARRALSILGFTEPKGGWDTFEGFTVPYPPPSPRHV